MSISPIGWPSAEVFTPLNWTLPFLIAVAPLIGEGKGPVDAYLDMDGIIELAKSKNVDAIHPGYGFLSENPEFVRKCEENGITFIGPTAEIMNMMGDKINSKKIAKEVNVPTIPGINKPIESAKEAKEVAAQIGYPVMLKASNGGGGRGMRVVYNEDKIEFEYQTVCSESRKAFGEDVIFIEKYVVDPKRSSCTNWISSYVKSL